MTARPVSESEWLKGAYAQAEEWHTNAVTRAKQRVAVAHEELTKARDELDDTVRRRAELRESFARKYAEGA